LTAPHAPHTALGPPRAGPRIGDLALAAAPARGLEYPIGKPQHKAGLEVAAVYLQPVDMESGMPMRKAAEADVHLEADVHALADNANGFPEGGWVSFLQIRYDITKQPGAKIAGELLPMVASDGPHYGDNVKLAGPGKYRVRYTIYAPNAPGNAAGRHFGRHTDRATGVGPWFEPFAVEWEFAYAGVGKKGGY
jgi:uncharacterized protein involved in high-affinity Fe2+ transport